MRWYELTKYAQYKCKQKPLLLKLGAGQIHQRGFSEHSWPHRLCVQSPLRIGGSQYNTTSTQAERGRPIRARFSGDTGMHIHEPRAHHGITTHKATYRRFSSKNDVPRSSAEPPRLAVSDRAHNVERAPEADAICLDNLVVISEDRLSEFDQQWNKHKIVVLRSPPASGKTTFLKRLEWYSKNKKGRVVRRISMPAVERMEANSFDDDWEKVAGESWSSYRTCTVPTDILIDEAQILYRKADFFSRYIKGLVDHPNPNIRVLLSMSYDGPTGGDKHDYFPYALGLECLHLKRGEFDQLVESFVKCVCATDEFELTIPMNVREVIFKITAGHPHIVRETLQSLKVRSRSTYLKDSEMLEHLFSPEYYFAIKHLRVWNALWNMEMTNDNIEFLRNAYHHVDSKSTFPVKEVDDHAYTAAQAFQDLGLITKADDGRRMQFAVPLMRGILGIKLFTALIPPTQSALTFDAFLLLTLERMRPSSLRNSLSLARRKGARLSESQWQLEWATAAQTAIKLPRYSISPGVGVYFRSPGYLDLYIDGDRQWGVEIMREGIDLGQHVRRFKPNGLYKKIPFKHRTIIDFRHHSKVPKHLRPNVLFAMYADNYETITVRRKGHEDQVITLCGD